MCPPSPLHTPSQPSGLRGGAVVLAMAMGTPATGWTQNTPAPAPAGTTTVAQVQSLDRFEAEQERLKKQLADSPAAYVDKVMDPSELPPLNESDSAARGEQPEGVRTWLYETRVGHTRQSGSDQNTSRETELGLRTELRRETINYGEWVLQADVRNQSNNDIEGVVSTLGQTEEKRGERVSLRNLGFPITPEILADTSVGDLNSEITDGLARSYRLSLGTSNVRGLGVRAFSRNFDLRAGTGARGQLVGGPYPGFERETGQLSWLGYTHRWGDKLYASAQLQRAANTAWSGSSNAFDTEEAVQSTSLAASVGWGYQLVDSGDKRVRLTLLNNRDAAEQRDQSQSARGAYLEAAWLEGRYQNETGLYRTDPQLRFGDQWISDGGMGAYWRLDHLGIRTSWGLGVHHDQRDSDAVSNTRGQQRNTFTGNIQHRIDGRNSVGGNVYYSDLRFDDASASGTAGLQTTYATAYFQTRQRNWGNSRLRLTTRRNQTLVSDEPAATGDEIEWEQDWIPQSTTETRSQLQTTLGWARDRSAGQDFVYPTAGLRFRHWIDTEWNVGGSLRHTSRRGSLSTSRGLSGSFDTERRLGGGWQLGASVYLNQTLFDYTPSGSDPIASTLSSRSNNTSAYVYLRYEGQSGRGFSTPELSGQQRIGAGSISGQVFYDVDRDGVQQLAEGGVAGVEVWLDQRYRTTTDAQGNFEFPVVSTGSHQLTLRLESVPLPWGASAGSRLVVDVPLRGRAVAPIPVVKTGE